MLTYGPSTPRPRHLRVLDLPPPLVHESLLPLRVEIQLGYKTVTYLRAVELVAEDRTIGDGQGGSRGDATFDGRRAETP